jgi:hypothetical protein
VHLVEIDMIDAQALQTGLDRRPQICVIPRRGPAALVAMITWSRVRAAASQLPI